jgi:tetratricopeptide (TPR) repeat protein
VDPLQDEDPRKVGDYELLGRLGAGGMGRVFLGVSPGGRKVAVKVIHSALAADPEFRERFRREVAAALRVGGFHTAQVVDADPSAKSPWMVTAYVPGPSLSALVRERGPLGVLQVLALAAALAEDLKAIHSLRLVHRDLNPRNVIIADNGPRIIDFGIALAEGVPRVTATGDVIGTVAYMSPEQARGDPTGPESDVFSLGSVLAFAATGVNPFEAGTSPSAVPRNAAVLFRVTHEPPNLDGLPEELRDLVLECLAKDSADRPRPEALLARLAPFKSGPVIELAAPATALADGPERPDLGAGDVGVPPPELRLDGENGIAHAGAVSAFPGMPRAVTVSANLELVRRIAPRDPPGLQGRDAELAELARFCLAPDGPAYAWWRAGPWAGKSALLSSFVARPPAEVAERVRIVSFFTTPQDNREVFTEVITEQLATLLGVPSAAPTEAYLLDLLARAAATCQQAGGRLVLVVDGLDEDRSVTVGPDARSIAGLLPASPPAGMRVIVAGRPAPPFPDDVQDEHPLREPVTIRPLDASPHARDLRPLAGRELQRLLRGGQTERDMLGLLAAARGGLTARDLAEVTQAPLRVKQILRAASGRTFQGRPSLLLQTADRPEAYLLGHEELQAAAAEYLSDRLDGYRERLHAWADAWCARRWPTETPEYLLVGYFQLLEDLGDLPGMTGLALDTARHDMMLDLTGGDVAALTETRAALDRIAAQDAPDLTSALALAYHRDHLIDRNANIPATLPSVWAAIGQLPHAQALADSITKPESQAKALSEVARTLVGSERHQQAESFAAQAVATAHAITDSRSQAKALSEVARTLAEAGLYEQAEAAVRAITNQYEQPDALSEVATALARAGLHQQAEAIAREITRPRRQAEALTEIARALAGAGLHQQAEALARAITEPDLRADALVQVARALAKAGLHQQAESAATQAEAATREITNSVSQAKVLAQVAGALASAGRHPQAENAATRAETLAREITDPHRQAELLPEVVGALTEAGLYQRAETLARTITEPIPQAQALAGVARALTEAGLQQRAQALARTITEQSLKPHALAMGAREPDSRLRVSRITDDARVIHSGVSQAEALAEIARTLAQAGFHQQAENAAAQAEVAARAMTSRWQASKLAGVARTLAEAGLYQRAEALARTITEPEPRANALAGITRALAEAGLHQRAEALARTITEPDWHAYAMAKVASALAEAGFHQQAANAAALAMAAARAIASAGRQAAPLAGVARALAEAGLHQQAEAAARAITDPYWQADTLAIVAETLAEAGLHVRAGIAAAQAEALAREITNPHRQAEALAWVVRALAEAGRHVQAEALARTITQPGPQAEALAEVARTLAEAGRHVQAEALARTITNRDLQAHALAGVARALARAGLHRQATAVARVITKADDLAKIAEALASAGRPRQAAAVVRAITHPAAKAGALAGVASALASSGRHRQAEIFAMQAEAVARTIISPDSRARARTRITSPDSRVLAEVARALARAGLHDRAVALADTIDDWVYSREAALAEVAGALAEAGRYERAEAIARKIIGRQNLQARALAKVASALASGGQHQQAENIVAQAEAAARAITEPKLQAEALAEVAATLTSAGLHRQAEAAARTITIPDSRASALAQIAGALARAGEATSARRVAAAACAAGRWTNAIDPVILLAPSAGAPLARMLDERRSRRVAGAPARERSQPDPRHDGPLP